MKKRINKGKVVLEIPKDIQELAKEFRKERLQREETNRIAKQKRDQINKEIRADRLKNGLPYATKIFFWARELRCSAIGQELMRKAHIPTAYSTILFFDGNIIGMPWVGLGISPDGMFWTHGSGRCYFNKQVSSPENLAESVYTEILKMASEWIDSGQVWGCVKTRFAYLQK